LNYDDDYDGPITCPEGSVMTGIGGRYEGPDELHALWPYCRSLDLSNDVIKIFSSQSTRYLDRVIPSAGEEKKGFPGFAITCNEGHVLTGVKFKSEAPNSMGLGGLQYLNDIEGENFYNGVEDTY